MDDEQRKTLLQSIDRYSRRFGFGSRAWSALHHGALYLAAILSTASALLLKSDFVHDIANKGDIAAACSAVAALFGTLAAAGGFQRKWQANRIDRGEIEQIRLDLASDTAALDDIRARLKALIERHDKSITGS